MALPVEASRRPVLAITVLVAILAFAVDSMLVQLSRNGYTDLIHTLADTDKPALLPGTTRPILRRFTGIAALDRIYVVANIFWATLVDGSRPECALYLLQFGGQLPAVIIMLLVESRRVAGPHALLRSVAFWGIAMQMFGFGIAMPLYAILYLVLPKPAPAAPIERAQLQNPIQLHAVGPAFILGYLFPTALLIFPYDDAASRQRANIMWQYFPLYVLMLITGFSEMAKRVSLGQNINTSIFRQTRFALSHAYGFALTFAAIFQWATYATLFVAWAYPDHLPRGLASRLTPGSVFVPSAPHSYAAMESPAAATHDFVKFDQLAGSAAVLVWTMALCQEVGVKATPLLDMFRDVLILGPVAAGAKMLRKRDMALLSRGR